MGRSVKEVREKIKTKPPDPIRAINSAVHAAAEALCLRCLRKRQRPTESASVPSGAANSQGDPGSIMTALLVALALLAVLSGFYAARRIGAPSKEALEQTIYSLPKAGPIRAAGGVQQLQMSRADGSVATLSYVRHGERGDHPPIVLVHPTPHTLLSFVDTAFGEGFGLAGDREVLLLEVVGHGVTRTPHASPLTFQQCADWVADAIRALELGPAVLVGQSYSGEFVWRCAVDHPELVAGLVLMDSAGVPRREGDWLPEEIKMREMSAAKIGWLLNSADRVRGALEIHYPKHGVDADQARAVYETCRHPGNWSAMVDLARDENGERIEDLAKLACPTLLLWGSEDAAYEPGHYAEEFRRRIPDVEMQLLDGVGHYGQEEVPAEVADAIRAFSQRLRAPAS